MAQEEKVENGLMVKEEGGTERSEVAPRSLGAKSLKCCAWAFNQNWHKQWVRSPGATQMLTFTVINSPQKVLCGQIGTNN